MKRVVEALSCNGLLWISQRLNSSLFNKNALHLILPALALQIKHKAASCQVGFCVFLLFLLYPQKVLVNFSVYQQKFSVCQHNLSLAVNLIYFGCDLFSYIFKWHTGAN